jgi:hypothetical protein
MSSEISPTLISEDDTMQLTLPTDSHTQVIDEVRDAAGEVDGVSNHLSKMVINTASRLIPSNSAAFEKFRRLDGIHVHRKIGERNTIYKIQSSLPDYATTTVHPLDTRTSYLPVKCRSTTEKSSQRPLRKHILISEDRIRRNFSFPSLLDEDIIISPLRWFEHITDHSSLKDSDEDLDNSIISSYNRSESTCSSTASNSPFNPSSKE